MDPLSITASVITVIGLADKIISVCKCYVAEIRDAPSELCKILIEVGSLKIVLETLELRADLKAILEGSLDACKDTLIALEKLFPQPAECLPDGKRRKIARALQWPFKEDKARKLLEDIGRHKASMSLTLTTDLSHDIKEIKTHVDHLKCDLANVQNSLTDNQRGEILRWLVSTDPSSIHITACDLHEPQTGKWLIRSPEYSDWLDGPTRFLWLHGIPGAGKTVLASFVAENVGKLCSLQSRADTTWVYYYCYFGRDQDETSHLLRWLIDQLCRQSKYIPDIVQALYHQGRQPNTADLFSALGNTLRNFRRVYIIIDALDESRNRDNLMKWLTLIATASDFTAVKLFATSRSEMDIKRALGPISVDVSLSNPLVDEDIQTYIRSRLYTESQFRRWPESLKTEIERALVEGSKGMFRWTTCQLDILARVNSEAQIRKALRELPETLDETYERILASIPASKFAIAHKALSILTFAPPVFANADCLAEAVVVDVERAIFDPSNRLFDPEDLLEICVCLIAQRQGLFRLAHYSVQEYLLSDRIQQGKMAMFHISEVVTNITLVKTLLIYLLHRLTRIALSGESIEWGELDMQTLFVVAMGYWNGLLWQLEEGDAGVDELLLKFVDPAAIHSDLWLEATPEIAVNSEGNRITLVREREYPPFPVISGGRANVIFAYTLYFDAISAARAFQSRNSSSLTSNGLIEVDDHGEEPYYLSLLEYAVLLRNDSFTKLFLDQGSDPNMIDVDGRSVLILSLLRDYENIGFLHGPPSYCIVDLLLSAGADPNFLWRGETPLTMSVSVSVYLEPLASSLVQRLLAAGANPNLTGVRETPLQVVARTRNFAVVQLLLDAGADVNAISDNTARAFIEGLPSRDPRRPTISKLINPTMP